VSLKVFYDQAQDILYLHASQALRDVLKPLGAKAGVS
jgi:hypothetical protein